MSIAIQTRQLFQSAAGCPLGRITLAGTIRKSTGSTTGPMRILGSYAIVYLVGGGGRYEDALGRRKEARAGDLLLLFPDIGHWYSPAPGGRWDEIYIVFDGPVFDLWRKRGVLAPDAPIYHLEPLEYWLRRFEEVVAPNLPALERVCRLQSVLSGVFTHYQRNPAAARDEEWLARACELLDAGIGEELYVEDVPRRLGISVETFRKKFARLAGAPPWRYRMTRVIERGCRLVHEGRLTNKEIAAKLGFNDEFHFSRRFKQITGRSPTQFRTLSVPG
ncbi:MAG: AraC family transcriptional regulator [Terrimicrobiaceae bacterium]|nr:AraC family transcriptional regulator [Terrimicrobiaceae bacterium]